jgi:hypothetical protein
LIEDKVLVDLLQDRVLEGHAQICLHELQLEVNIARRVGPIDIVQLSNPWVIKLLQILYLSIGFLSI